MTKKQIYFAPCTDSVTVRLEQAVAISYDSNDRTEIMHRDADEEDL